jgi:uncharacterized membrane protein YheB (UPF0754 family)
MVWMAEGWNVLPGLTVKCFADIAVMDTQSTGIERYVASIAPADSYQKIVAELEAMINELIGKDFEMLVSILYRMDINENRLKQLLIDFPGQLAGKMIAELMIERQLQKIKSREQFRQPPPVNDDDKW